MLMQAFRYVGAEMMRAFRYVEEQTEVHSYCGACDECRGKRTAAAIACYVEENEESNERITVQMHPVCPFPLALLVLDCGMSDEDVVALALVEEMIAVVSEFSCCGGVAECSDTCQHHAGLIASVKVEVGRLLAMSPGLLYQAA